MLHGFRGQARVAKIVRAVFLSDKLVEREKDFGYIELMMTLRFPERNVTFRNLGWSADTPVGISRASFDY